jgi:hypothetical protein
MDSDLVEKPPGGAKPIRKGVEMSARGKWITVMSLLLLPLFWPVCTTIAQDRYTDTGRDRWEQPLDLEDMEPYKDIQFDPANFDQIENGMTEEEVLALLGKPADLKKEHRRHDRWTVHYFYPDGRVVNFRDGLVVGKENP